MHYATEQRERFVGHEVSLRKIFGKYAPCSALEVLSKALDHAHAAAMQTQMLKDTDRNGTLTSRLICTKGMLSIIELKTAVRIYSTINRYFIPETEDKVW